MLAFDQVQAPGIEDGPWRIKVWERINGGDSPRGTHWATATEGVVVGSDNGIPVYRWTETFHRTAGFTFLLADTDVWWEVAVAPNPTEIPPGTWDTLVKVKGPAGFRPKRPTAAANPQPPVSDVYHAPGIYKIFVKDSNGKIVKRHYLKVTALPLGGGWNERVYTEAGVAFQWPSYHATDNSQVFSWLIVRAGADVTDVPSSFSESIRFEVRK